MRTRHNEIFIRRWKSKAGRLKEVRKRFTPRRPYDRFLWAIARHRMPVADAMLSLEHAIPRHGNALWMRLHAVSYPHASRYPRSAMRTASFSPAFLAVERRRNRFAESETIGHG